MAWWVDASGYLASVLVFTAFFMRTAVNIRLFAIASNAAFVVYGTAVGSMPILVLHSLLLPLNIRRLYEMRMLTRRVKTALESDLNFDWLRPYVKRRSYRAGEVVFRKGEPADEMFIAETGQFRLPAHGIVVPTGDIVGELGILNPSASRTDGLVCEQDGTLLTISYDEVRQLYFQNPEFGFYFLKLTSRRLFANLARLEAEVSSLSTQDSVEPTTGQRTAEAARSSG
jgi:CRP/FNR family cyclic AMP-dependent transcriptional regulator